MEYKIEYGDKSDRLIRVAEQESLDRQMLHDDHLPTGNVMTFTDPIPPTPEELERVLYGQAREEAIEEITQAKLTQIRSLSRIS